MRPWKACWIASLFLPLGSSFASQQPSSVLDSHQERKSVADEHYEIGLYFMEQGMSDTARGHFQYALAIDPDHEQVLGQLGRLYYLKGEAPEARGMAELYFTRLLELSPRNLLALLYRAELRMAQGRFEAAESDARAGLAVEPEKEAMLMLQGSALLRLLRFAEAAAVYQKVLALSPKDPLARWNLALATERAGMDRSALPEELQIDYPREDALQSPVRFTNVAHSLGMDVLSRGRPNAWADFDQDGWEDLFAAGIRDPHALFRNNGDGSFTEITKEAGLKDPRGGWSALAADYDNDGDPDLYVTRDGWKGRAANSFYLNDGRARFVDVAPQIGITATADSFTAAYADFDKDGFLDLYVANGVSFRQGFPNVLYRNRGDGRFEDVSVAAGVAGRGSSVGCAWGDYNGDGFPDVYVANYGGDNALYRNRGDGTFEDVTIASKTVGPHYSFVTFFFDYNNDGKLDLFIASWTGDFRTAIRSTVEGRVLDPDRRLALLRNNGDGTFTDVTDEAGLARNCGAMSAAYFDLDNDGYLDIVVGTGGPTMDRYEPDVVFLNRGDGTFADISQSSRLANYGKTHGITGHDFNRDGFIDLYTSVGGQEIGDRQANGFFRNEGTDNHWLSIRLVGTRSNRDGVGAKVTVWTSERLRFQEVAIGGGFGSTNGAPLHFGLGANLEADRVEIQWPSGTRQDFLQIPGDRLIWITEGEEGYRLDAPPDR